MRITNRMLTTKYMRSLSILSSDLDKNYTQVTTGRKFSKSSENTSAAIKAYQIRSDYSRVVSYQSSVSDAKAHLTDSESALLHMEELVKEAHTKILEGVNGTQSEQERKIIANELKNIQDQIFQTLNTNVSGRYLFGGSNTDTRPFEVGADGKLVYNKSVLDDPIAPATLSKLTGDALYTDIGLNMSFNPAAPPASSTVDKSTVFEYSLTGIKVTGYGSTSITLNGAPEDVSNNMYGILGKMAEEFNSTSYSTTDANSILKHFEEKSSCFINAVTEVGAKTAYLDFMTNRLESRDSNLQAAQLETEGIDPAKAIIQFKSQQVAYNAALQMGTQLIQPSIFDFMS